MTREEARQAADVLIAFADGKKIETRFKKENEWYHIDCMGDKCHFDFEFKDYRIAKEPQYRPFKSSDECLREMFKHQPFGWIKRKDNGHLIILGFIDGERDFASMFKHSTFVDGEPFGVKIE